MTSFWVRIKHNTPSLSSILYIQTKVVDEEAKNDYNFS